MMHIEINLSIPMQWNKNQNRTKFDIMKTTMRANLDSLRKNLVVGKAEVKKISLWGYDLTLSIHFM
jgi:hypothetical protein